MNNLVRTVGTEQTTKNTDTICRETLRLRPASLEWLDSNWTLQFSHLVYKTMYKLHRQKEYTNDDKALSFLERKKIIRMKNEKEG